MKARSTGRTVAGVGLILALVGGGGAAAWLTLRGKHKPTTTPRSQWVGGVNPDLPAQTVQVATNLPSVTYQEVNVNLDHLGDGAPTYNEGWYV